MEILIGVIVVMMAIKLLQIAFKLAYGVGILVLAIMALPFALIFMAMEGLFFLGLPVLAAIMIISLLFGTRRRVY